MRMQLIYRWLASCFPPPRKKCSGIFLQLAATHHKTTVNAVYRSRSLQSLENNLWNNPDPSNNFVCSVCDSWAACCRWA